MNRLSELKELNEMAEQAWVKEWMSDRLGDGEGDSPSGNRDKRNADAIQNRTQITLF